MTEDLKDILKTIKPKNFPPVATRLDQCVELVERLCNSSYESRTEYREDLYSLYDLLFAMKRDTNPDRVLR